MSLKYPPWSGPAIAYRRYAAYQRYTAYRRCPRPGARSGRRKIRRPARFFLMAWGTPTSFDGFSTASPPPARRPDGRHRDPGRSAHSPPPGTAHARPGEAAGLALGGRALPFGHRRQEPLDLADAHGTFVPMRQGGRGHDPDGQEYHQAHDQREGRQGVVQELHVDHGTRSPFRLHRLLGQYGHSK